MRRVATQIFLAFAVSLAAFGAVAAFAVVRLGELRQDLRLLSAGYFPLTRIAAQLEVKDWVASRALEARALDRAAREAYLPAARAQLPALVRGKLEEGKRVVASAGALVRGDDARFLAQVSTRLEGLSVRWAEYDREANALFDALQAGEGQRAGDPGFEARVQRVRRLEKAISTDVAVLQATLEEQITYRVRATEQTESRTVQLIVIYSLLALAVGAGAALISRRLLAPIQRLTEGVKAVAAGDLSRQVEVRGANEIGLLAVEFNAMAASLDRQRAALRRAERLAAVGRISAQITHEIRNPLNAIGLNAELLAEEIAELPSPPPDARGLVAAISREVDRLNGVVEQYLGFARLPRPSFASEDANEMLGGLLDFLTPELSAAGVQVHRELDPALPPLRGDESQLRGVFLNLIRNAREAMPGGGTLTVRTRPFEGSVEVGVADTGGGIPPGDLPRIFEPFYSTKERGTGLGLAFTQQVVEEHGGTIRCESELGRGTVFTLRFPAAPAEAGHSTAGAGGGSVGARVVVGGEG